MASTRKKRPTSDEVKGLLLEGNFGGNSDALPLTDPVTTTQMVLKLSDIKPYDRNPRRDPNPAYDEIKESIRSKKQLNNNFNVTRRPGDDLFMVESGGNTRLQILNELYKETGDEAFNTVHCLFVPWKSESAVLTAHLIENEMRGDMSLIDKAYATQELKQQLEDEHSKVLSDIEFTRQAAAIGYKISPKHLRRFNYALELDQMIPQVMRSGLGGHKVDEIKKVAKGYRQFCEDKTNQFDAAFMSVMADSDGNEFWDFEEVRSDLDERLSELTGVRENLLRIQVDAIVFNNTNSRQDVRDLDLTDQPFADNDSGNAVRQMPQSEQNTPQNEIVDHFLNDEIEHNDDDETLADTETTEQLSEITQESEKRRRKAEGSSRSTKESPSQQLKLLRQKNYDLACGIARLSELDDAVMPVDDGLGFLMEMPSRSFTELANTQGTDKPEFVRRYFVWWLLLSVAEQKVGREHHFIWQHLKSWQILKNQDEYLPWVGSQPDFSVLMCEFLHNKELISDQAFTNLFRLLESCRTLRSTFSDAEIWSLSK